MKKFLNAPTSLAAAISEIEGQVELHWDSVYSASCYAIEYRQEGSNAKWKMIDIVSRPRYTVAGLSPNITYCFRVAAMNNSHRSEWSDVVTKKI